MNVSLRGIDQGNFRECMRLAVRKDQPFVASNAFSVAESKLFPFWITRAIYEADTMVGFMMYAKEYDKGELYLCRFMIDARHQGKGYGRAALELLKAIALEDGGINRMKLSTAPDNSNGIRIYERFGFVDMKVMDDDEEVFVLELGKGKREEDRGP